MVVVIKINLDDLRRHDESVNLYAGDGERGWGILIVLRKVIC